MGNWILLCNFLEAGRGIGKPAQNGTEVTKPALVENKVIEKKSVDISQTPALPEEKILEQKVADVRRQSDPYLQKQQAQQVVVPEVKQEEIAAPVNQAPAEIKVTPPVPPVVAPEVKPVPKAEPVPPVAAEVKVTSPVPPVVVPEVKPLPKAEPVIPVAAEVKVTPTAPPVAVPEVKPVSKAEPVIPVAAEVKVTPPVPPVVAPEVKSVPKAEPVIPVAAEVKVTPPAPPVAVPEVKPVPKAEPVIPVAAEVKATPVVAAIVPEKVKQEAVVEKAHVPTKEEVEVISQFIPAKVIIKKQIEVAEETKPVVAKQKAEPPVSKEAPVEYAEVVTNDEKEKLILPIYTEDYFLQQGVKVALEIPEEIDDLKEVIEVDDDDPDKSLMVMMSFSEWLLHFKNTAEKQKDERKDQKALKTMWQKEKLAAAMEEENEEIPENVFEMAVNSITREDGLASESLADIYIKQGKYDQAIEMYRKLSLRNPKKNAYFARRIEEVLKEKQS